MIKSLHPDDEAPLDRAIAPQAASTHSHTSSTQYMIYCMLCMHVYMCVHVYIYIYIYI